MKRVWGCRVFIKLSVYELYDVEVVDKCADGIIALLFKHKHSGYSMLLTGVYIPPDNSIYGRHVETFLENLNNLLYEYNDCDLTALIGDFNSRVGFLKDFIEEIDDVPA